MNPITIIAGFVVLLGIILYNFQRKETEILPRAESESKDKQVIKASEYQAQYKKEESEKETKKEKPVSKPEIKSMEKDPEKDDISTLDGVGPKYQELLRAAGYTSIKAIAMSNPEELYAKLIETNKEKEITKRPPTMSNVEEWINSAGSHKA
jgi:predicted flap endonuclease-1-like 5' DNA nuclease